ncbi:unnamed protein product [Nesidiocoris tenuis]|uniref:Uncharacterized protein n=1 Tax=Nesidiocoris tenuis TaxID=355587 RepID=A0A6H5H8Y5_9HEMI|nr:unnamed protein product [Nesidiocoris tenuis]
MFHCEFDFDFNCELESMFHCDFDFDFDYEFEVLFHCEFDFDFDYEFEFLFHCEFDFDFDYEFEVLFHCEFDFVSNCEFELMFHCEFDFDFDYEIEVLFHLLKDEFKVVPKDLKVAAGEEAILECHPPDGNPPPSLFWRKDGEIIDFNERLKTMDQGSLKIVSVRASDEGKYQCVVQNIVGLKESPPASLTVHELELTDSGEYTCTGSSEAGTSTWSAWLTVERSPGAELHRAPDPSTYPRAPSTPRVVNASSNSLTVAWDPPSGTSTLIGYRLEYFSPELQTGWVTAAMRVISHTFTILSDDYYEGVYIRYREIPGWNKFHMVTVNKPDVSEYTVKELKKYTRYEFFLMPFYKSIEGHPTISKIVQTLEDVPSGPPQNVEIEIVNATAAYVRWSPPAQDHHNGVLQGYKLQVKGNSTKVLAELTMNPTSTHLLLNNLTSKGAYSVRVAAFTSSGMGSWSEQVTLATGQARGLRAPKSGETWLVLLVIVMALLLGLACSSVLYLRRRQSNKQLGHLSVPVVNTNNLTLMRTGTKDGGVWLDRDWATEMSKQDEQMECVRSETECADYAEVDTKQLATYYASGNANKEGPTPYATTTLLARPQNCPLRHSPEISNMRFEVKKTKIYLGNICNFSSRWLRRENKEPTTAVRRAGRRLGRLHAPQFGSIGPPIVTACKQLPGEQIYVK